MKAVSYRNICITWELLGGFSKNKNWPEPNKKGATPREAPSKIFILYLFTYVKSFAY